MNHRAHRGHGEKQSLSDSCAYLTRVLPDADFDNYETIFVGQVTGVHLFEYQSMMIEGYRKDPDFSVWTDTTLQLKVTILPKIIRKGKAKELEILNISGCGVLEPDVKQLGIFFIRQDGKVDVVYNSESYLYEEYLLKLGRYWRENLRKTMKSQSHKKPKK